MELMVSEARGKITAGTSVKRKILVFPSTKIQAKEDVVHFLIVIGLPICRSDE
jgi:hypothetical protein